jgi:hypothetical protein
MEEMELPAWLKPEVIVYDWCKYRGEIYFAVLNWEESDKRNKPVIDLAYCATKAMNGIFIMQRVWNKNFQPHKFNFK